MLWMLGLRMFKLLWNIVAELCRVPCVWCWGCWGHGQTFLGVRVLVRHD